MSREKDDRMRAALLEACDLLQGWINWKCPARHRTEHLAKLAQLRAAAAPGDGTVPALIIAVPVGLRLPDADTDVLIFDGSDPEAQLGAVVGADEEGAIWVNAQGEGVAGVTYWAEMPRLP